MGCCESCLDEYRRSYWADNPRTPRAFDDSKPSKPIYDSRSTNVVRYYDPNRDICGTLPEPKKIYNDPFYHPDIGATKKPICYQRYYW